ncbi:hypothetical protein LEMLEM_LOCUS763 [Lemmus lemmus]
MGAVTDNEVIRKHLLIGGDGAGGDQRINLLVKSFVKWCNSGSQEEGYSQYQRMLSTPSQCDVPRPMGVSDGREVILEQLRARASAVEQG